MEKLTTVEGKAYPFGMKNVDTDIVIPSHWLKTISRTGLGKGAFEVLRKEPGNVFDDPAYAGDAFAAFREAVATYQPARQRDHAYWQGAGPCSMHIEEVEAIWAHIAEDDDWSPLNAKIDAIRAMGAAYRS